MTLKDLFSPKWKHSRSEVRLAAVESLHDNPDTLAEIAKIDAAPAVRGAAIRLIGDDVVLESIIATEQDPQVRKIAQDRRASLLEKTIAKSSDPYAVIVALEKHSGEKAIAAYLCEHRLDPSLQDALVKRLQNPLLLCKITEHECSLESGENIIGRLSEKEHLERISRKASNKKIRLLAKKKIDALYPDPLAARQAVTDELEECCAAMDQQVGPDNIEQAAALLDVSQKTWSRLDPERTHPLAAKFAAAEKLLTERIERGSAIRSSLVAMEELCRQAELLSQAPLESAEEQLMALQAQWNSIPALTGIETEKLADRFAFALTAARGRIIRVKEERERTRCEHEPFEKCCDDLNALIENGADLDGRKFNKILSEWKRIAAALPDSSPFIRRFADLQKKYEEKSVALAALKKSQVREASGRLLHLVQQMETISRAKPHRLGTLYGDAMAMKRDWEKECPLVQEERRNLEGRFRSAFEVFMERHHEFKTQLSWQKWATENAKTKTLAEIEQFEGRLLQGDSPIHLARRVNVFERQWRQAYAGGSGPIDSDARFAAARDRIFNLGRSKKSDLLQTLKSALASAADQDIAEEVKNLQKQWNDIGYLPAEMEKEIADEFYSLCNDFFEQRKERHQKHLEDLQKNMAIREEICREAATWAESTDWKASKNAFDELQARWDGSWPAPMKRSRELWREFGKYRDLFYAKYDEFKQGNVAGKEALCEQAEQLLAQCEAVPPPLAAAAPQPVGELAAAAGAAAPEPPAPGMYRRIFNQALALQRKWKESGPVSKTAGEKLWDRFNIAQKKVFSIVNNEFEKNRLLKEALVARSESLAASEAWEETAREFYKIHDEWKTIKPAGRHDDQALWARLQSAGNAFFDRRRRHFDQLKNTARHHAKRCETLIAELEVLVRVAGKSHRLKGFAPESAAEVLKKGIELRNELEVEGDPEKTARNISRRVTAIIAEWEHIAQESGRPAHRQVQRFNELVGILRSR